MTRIETGAIVAVVIAITSGALFIGTLHGRLSAIEKNSTAPIEEAQKRALIAIEKARLKATPPIKLTKRVSCKNNCKKFLGNSSNRFCFLTKVMGAFNGPAESANVTISNGVWQLTTSSGGSPTWATANCVTY